MWLKQLLKVIGEYEVVKIELQDTSSYIFESSVYETRWLLKNGSKIFDGYKVVCVTTDPYDGKIEIVVKRR